MRLERSPAAGAGHIGLNVSVVTLALFAVISGTVAHATWERIAMIIAGRHVLGACLLLTAWSAEAATYSATAKTLKSVFAKAVAGDRIVLSGSFASTTLQGKSFKTPVTIDARAATFTDTLKIYRVSGLTVLGGKYGSTTGTMTGMIVSGGDRITLTNPVVVGDRGKSHGIDVANTTNVSITGGTFTGLRSGATFTNVTNGSLVNNKSLASTSDGFDIAGGHNINITGNSCSGTKILAGAHPDCVQTWSLPGQPQQSDITISGNTATGDTQGFTTFDGKLGGIRIKMTDNRVDITYTQAIACFSCVDSVITGNVITTQKGARWAARITIDGGSNNTVRNNSVGAYQKISAPEGDTSAFDAARVDLLSAEVKDFTTFGKPVAGPDSTAQVIRADGAGEFGERGGEVPEPAVWALMLAGFGLVGTAMRRRAVVAA